jgi:tetratricopeptide (TPR) repeat protein
LSRGRLASGGRKRRGVRSRAFVAVLVALSVGACAGPGALLESTSRSAPLPPVVELASTPFHPQADQQCGPAALATVLGAARRPVTSEALAREIFVPGRQGSLQPELIGAIRARGLLPYELGADLGELTAELAAGRPVLVLQKQGLGPWPAWHYAVAVGYDTARDTVLLRSGTTERLALRAATFDATWSRAGRWAIVAIEPGTLPARPDLSRYVHATAALESVGQLDAASAAYQAAVRQWPDSPMPRFGLANVAAARGDWAEAERGYRATLQLEPRLAAALNNRAEALAQLGCPITARRELERGAAAIGPDDPLRATLARTLAELEARGGVSEEERCRCYGTVPCDSEP